MHADLATFDIAVIIVYFAAVLAHGFWSGRRERNADDYFLAGRSLAWPLIGASLYASNMSGASFVGLIGASYEYGLVVFNYEWTAAAVLIFFALFMAPVFLRAKLFTVPEYLKTRFDERTCRLYAAFTLFTLMFIDIAGALFAGGLVISMFIPALSLWGAAALIALLAGVYTVAGGLRAVVVTDAVQAALMIVGSLVILWAGLGAVGGWDALFAELDASRTQMIKPASDDFLPWTGLFGVLLLGFYYWTLNQYFVQRVLAARDLKAARRGALFGGFLKLPNLFFMMLPGLIAFVLFPALDRPDLAFPTLIVELLPAGLKGLIVTALIAAIMSSLDSAFNAGASIVTMDFVKPARPETGDHTLLWIGRAVTGAMMIFGMGVVPLVERFGSLFSYFQSTLAYITPAVVATFMGGLFVSRVSARAAFWTLLIMIPTGLALFVAKEVTGLWAAAGGPDIHFTIMAGLLFLAACALLAGLSVRWRGPAAKAHTHFRLPDLAHDHDEGSMRKWRHDYRWQALGLALLTIALIFYFR
ncbi:sodium:solute symporter family transporter [Hyphococcus luteus]|uniref:SSS family solute/sodium (Na+) symporter n=1 Tax=Hyphococcus luteus TaxID=2058213 RepID=A0A2S7K838_9PROT|nr:sodium/solute symporter [Marinicaulis flavus]PQA88656.1 SSS family solute/sodium (Na+) symporter [Marinicaulis flavus]